MFHGKSLAKIAVICESLQLISRAKNSPNTFIKTITSSNTGEVAIASKNRASFGTTITIEGFLSPIPVRKKCLKPDLELIELKSVLERFAIINPHVSFTLRNDLNNNLEFSIEKHSSITESLLYFYPQLTDNMQLLKIKRKQIKIQALLTTVMDSSVKLQYIYVNKRPIDNLKFRKLVRDLFNVKKEPIYIFYIKLPSTEVDFVSNLVNFRNMPLIESLIKKLVNKFLGKTEEIIIKSPKPPQSVSKLLKAIKGGPIKRKSEELNCDIMAKKPYLSPTKSGKDLIMEMFLKSTQIYASQDDFVTNETVIESNFFCEKSFKTRSGKLNTTMSVSVKIKSIRRENNVLKVSKGFQTDLEPIRLEKAIQTSFSDDESFDKFQPNNFSTAKKPLESQLVISLPKNNGNTLIQNDIEAEKNINLPFDDLNPSANSHSLNESPNLNSFDKYLPTEVSCILNQPKDPANSLFQVKERFEHVPKGFSPICEQLYDLNVSLSQNSKENLYKLLTESLESELKTVKWTNAKNDFDNAYKLKAKHLESVIPMIYDKLFNKFNKRVNDIKFDKKLLQEVEILGQLDCKFIIGFIKSMELLVIFDQHAIDERIRLESLQSQYKNQRIKLNRLILLFFEPSEWCLLKENEKHLINLGFSCDFLSNCLFIQEVPLCVYRKSNNETNLQDICKLLFDQIILLLKSGMFANLPKIIQNIISTEACRGAIKFGDPLTKAECSNLINKLCECDLPFQCAHGRPTIQPLIRICSNLNSGNVKINFKKLL